MGERTKIKGRELPKLPEQPLFDDAEQQMWNHAASLVQTAVDNTVPVPMGIAGRVKGTSTSKMYDDGGKRMRFAGEVLKRAMAYRDVEWSAEECEQLIERYFEDATECGMPPTIVGMAMYMGWTLAQFDYRVGKDDSRARVLALGKETVRLCIEQSALDGSIPILAYFHQQKAYHGVIERSELVVTPIRLDPTESEVDAIIDVLPDGSCE